MTASASSADWLVVVDWQPAFTHPDSAWYTSGIEAIADPIAALVPLFGDRVIFTRFLPPDELGGSWGSYYAKWPFAVASEAGWLWDVAAPFSGLPSVSSHRFSKWDVLRPLLGAHPTVAMGGVTTDCCVLATALAAVDDGAHVRIVADGCAAKSPAIHDEALALLARRSPQLEIVTSDTEIRAKRFSEGA